MLDKQYVVIVHNYFADGRSMVFPEPKTRLESVKIRKDLIRKGHTNIEIRKMKYKLWDNELNPLIKCSRCGSVERMRLSQTREKKPLCFSCEYKNRK